MIDTTGQLKKQVEDLEKQLKKKNHEIHHLHSLIDKILEQENKNYLR